MTTTVPQIWLASQSPRRKILLEALGLSFQAHAPDAVEDHPTADSVEEVTIENSYRKAQLVSRRVVEPRDVIVAADTLVVINGEVLGKPADAAEVKTMLRKLSGNTHLVVTGLTLLSSHFGCRKSAVKSFIRFRKLSDQEILDYTKTREPYDKAGSYAVQGLGALFIEQIEGSYTNVMGLPIEQLLMELTALTKIPLYQWFA